MPKQRKSFKAKSRGNCRRTFGLTTLKLTAWRKLFYLNNAQGIQDLLVPPGNRLEALKSARPGQHSIRINDQWRICFVWVPVDAGRNTPAGALGVEIVDYH